MGIKNFQQKKKPKKYPTQNSKQSYNDQIRKEEQKLLQNEIESTRKPKTAKKPKRRKDLFYSSWAWRKMRLFIIERDKGRCAICGRTIEDYRDDGVTRVKISVDHILKRSDYPKLELEPDNLRVLCSDCHEAITEKENPD